MKRTHRGVLIAIALILILVLAACSRNASPTSNGFEYYSRTDTKVQNDASYEGAPTYTSEIPYGGEAAKADSVDLSASEKLIKTLALRVETLEFEKSVAGIRQITFSLGGYVESSTVDDYSYNNSRGYRTASFVLRIPANALSEFEKQSEGVGKTTSRTENVTNVTLSYSDLESRIQALTIQRDRMMEMLKEAKDVGEMLTIQDHLSEVEYKLESYSSQLRVMDNQIEYSTIRLSLQEVQIYTEPTPVTFWERLGSTFKDSLEDVGEFFEDLGLLLFGRMPQILVFAAIVFVIILIIRRVAKKRKAKADAEAKRLEEARQNAVYAIPVTHPEATSEEAKTE